MNAEVNVVKGICGPTLMELYHNRLRTCDGPSALG